ncbi:MAG: lipoyl(octanoyl) transferase LipB [Terracidiphilus sp.]
MIQYLYLGRVDYGEALRLQEEMAGLRAAGRIRNLLLLLEHPPVLTLGRNARRANILASDQLLARRGVAVHEINRGGDVTYHGPGQLVGYPIFDLRALGRPGGGRMGPVDFVRGMEEALIRLLASLGVAAGRVARRTGVWCGLGSASRAAEGEGMETCRPAFAAERKIAAIGIHVARGITTHGFALNVTTDLGNFQLIVPCGIADCSVTSLEQEIRSLPARPCPVLPSLASLARQAAGQFGQVFCEPVVEVASLDVLRAQAATAPEPAPHPVAEQPAQDTPLQLPAELERLRGLPPRPLRA